MVKYFYLLEFTCDAKDCVNDARGVFVAKKEEAKNEVKFLKEHSRIGKKYPNDFEISEQKVDSYNY